MIWDRVREPSVTVGSLVSPGSNGNEGQLEYTYTVDEVVTLMAGIANPFFWA